MDSTKTKTALIFGATGLTGKYLLNELIRSKVYSKIIVFGRDEFSTESQKVTFYKVNFDKLDEYADIIKGDDLFCCIGTTVKNAGSQKATEKVDFDYPVKIAEIAESNKVKSFLVISSLGANSKSASFYLRSKGKMEQIVTQMNFESVYALRPSMLLGKRDETRPGEAIGKIFVLLLGWMMIGKLKRFKGAHGKDVARAMIYLANKKYKETIIQSEKIKMLADEEMN